MRVAWTTFSTGTLSAMMLRKSNSISGSGMNISLALAWGSQSASRVRCPDSASPAARLTAVVLLPTPPLKLAKQMISATAIIPLPRCCGVALWHRYVATADRRIGGTTRATVAALQRGPRIAPPEGPEPGTQQCNEVGQSYCTVALLH